jgi:hypothetical protein
VRRHFVVDCETTSLTPDHFGGTGMIWELALVNRDDGTEYLYRMEPNLAKADPGALRVGRYYERTAKMKHRDHLAHDISKTPASRGGYWSNPCAVSVLLARMLDDATLIAAVPTFDAGFMADMLRAFGQAPTWHYRLRDFGSMAYGYLSACLALGAEGRDAALGVPALDAGTDEFAAALGVDVGKFERHTALGDCRLVCAGLDVMEGAR